MRLRVIIIIAIIIIMIMMIMIIIIIIKTLFKKVSKKDSSATTNWGHLSKVKIAIYKLVSGQGIPVRV